MAIRSFTTDSTPSENHPPQDAAEAPTVAALSREIGLLVRALRKRRGLSQEELGWRSGYCRTWISQVERGIACPSLATLHHLALTLDVPLTAFFPGGGPGDAAPSGETSAVP